MTQDVVGSNLKPFASEGLKEDKRGYGQNGYGGASSDVPGQKTTSGFLPQADLASAEAMRKRTQERTVSDQCYPLSHSMAQRSPRNK